MEGGEPGLPSSAPPSPRRREGKGRRRGCSPQPAPLREALGNGGAAEGSGRGGSTPAAPGPGEAPLRDRGAAGAPRPFLTSSLEHTLPA